MEIRNNNNGMYVRSGMYWCEIDGEKGSEQGGLRIILIIQNNIGNKYSPCIIGAIGTSQIHKSKLPTHVLIESNKYKYLPRDTVIMTEQLRTFDKIRLGDFVGELDEEDVQRVDLALKISLNLTDATINYNQNIEKIKNKIIEIDGYIKRWIYKGGAIIKLQDDMRERNNFICELKTECTKYNVKYENIYDETAITNLLISVAKGNKYNKEMVG